MKTEPTKSPCSWRPRATRIMRRSCAARPCFTTPNPTPRWTSLRPPVPCSTRPSASSTKSRRWANSAGMPLQNPLHLRVELAECLARRSLYERALDVLQDIDPPPADAATVEALRAEALIRLNRVQEGLEVLEKALSLYPSNIDLLRLRAERHVQDKQYENALTLLERALLIDRYDYACRNAFIDVLRILGRKEEIKKQQALLDEILSDIKERTRLTQEAMSKPWDAAARRKLAELWRKFGHEDMVQLWLKAAAACPPPSLFESGDKAEANRQTTPAGPSDKAAK